MFLGLNGDELNLSEPKAIEVMLALAADDLDQAEFADCVRQNSRSARRKDKAKGHGL